MTPPQYCVRCVLPDTRPGVLLDAEGICRGCRNADAKRRIDWDARARAFEELADDAKSRATTYDCVIPISGGKDSYWQVVTCLEHGLRPLGVTYVYPGRSALGKRNLQRLVELGVDHLELCVNPDVERRVHREGVSHDGNERPGRPHGDLRMAAAGRSWRTASRSSSMGRTLRSSTGLRTTA